MARFHRRAKCSICWVSLALLLAGAGCVSRNVESIGREEAASIPPPPPPPSLDGGAQLVASAGISGTIVLSPDHTDAVPDGVIYVVVRVAGRTGGAPLAVKQLPTTLPAQFVITERDAMIPGTPLTGDLDVIARLDQDGDALSRQPGDLEGRVGPAQVGDTVEIRLQTAAGSSGAESPPADEPTEPGNR